MTMLNSKNAHRRDKHIQFEESTHTYTIKGDSNYKSVTTWIHDFFPKFNPDLIIPKMRAGKNWGPDNQYYGMSDDEIKEKWRLNGQEAAALGTEMHLNIEYFYNGLPFNDGFTETKEYQLFTEYLADHTQLLAYRTEWTVYSQKYKLAGSIDMVYRDPDDPKKVIIADWKRSKEIKKSNKWDKGYQPLEHVDNCNYWHYTLQLNIYRMILETNYGQQVSDMFLVILHPNQRAYKKIRVPRISKEIGQMLKMRQRKIMKKIVK